MKLLIIALIVSLISLSIGNTGKESFESGKRDDHLIGKKSIRTKECFRDLNSFISCIRNLKPTNILMDTSSVSWKVPLPEKFEGPYKVNTLLEQATKLFENQLLGPESLALAPNGDLFTGTNDGTIYRITNDMLYVFAKIEGDLPLGVRYHRDGYIIVISAFSFYQIFMNQTVVKVFGVEDMKFADCEGSKANDDFDIIYGEGSNGGDVIYFSVIISKLQLNQWIYSVLRPDTIGRIIKYDFNTKTFTTIKKDLWFPNGVQLNDAKNALIVSEMTKRRILKIYIKGPNKGKTQVLISGLPGEPDNIRRSLASNETYWVALNFARNASNPLIGDLLSSDPVNRKLVLRATILFGNILSSIGNLVNVSSISQLGEMMFTGEFLWPIRNLPGMAIEFDSNGKILRTLQSPNNIFHSISEVREVKNENNERTLYFGSATNPYIGKCILVDEKCIKTD